MKAIWGVIEFLADDEEYDRNVRILNMVLESFGIDCALEPEKDGNIL